jgi:aerobic carbon-monoxide dehydrogenase large subunit
MTLSTAANPSTWQGRLEDDPLLKGAGRFGDDVKPAGALAAHFVRSPHACARITSIDTSAVRQAKGVRAVYTAADLADAHYHSVTHAHPIPGRGGKMPYSPERPVLAGERVMHVGEPVTLVIADDLAVAQEAGDQVLVDYEPLDAVTEVCAGAAPGAPQLWPDAPGNIGFDWTAPPDPDGKKQAALDRAFAEAAHVVKVDLINQRLVVASLEPRSATANYDAASGRYTLRCGTQAVGAMRGHVAEVMGIAPDKLHVTDDDVGGAFGMKGGTYPEYIALLHAAKALGRPVHWQSTRSEAFVSDDQGRDSFWRVELALNKRGRFLALKVDGLGNLGAYFTGIGHFITTLHIAGCLPTVYDIPLAQVNARSVFTNTVPTGPYRGAGRPEASYLLERVIDAAADQTGIDAAELRRRNLIAAEKMPFTTPFGNTYDGGDFPGLFEQALQRADYVGFAVRRKEAKKRGKRRGIGIGCYLEIAGAFPEEPARISFPGGDRIEVSIGAGASGQGHQTVFGKVAARRLGIAPEQVTVTSGDSDRDVPGFGAVASRSAMLTGGAIAVTADQVIEKGKRVAAMLLQVGEVDIDYGNGKFNVKNSGREVSLFEVAAHAAELTKQGVIKESLDTTANAKMPPSFPNGCHVAEVEIDPDTGGLEVVNYTAVGDSGNLLDETIVTAQIHGGVAQGLGQALTEDTVYDASGQLVSGSFMDYAMPRADAVPPIDVAHFTVACRTNPLGTKGAGEAGATAAPPALINAILDALPPGTQLDMPATPARIWQALQMVK